MNCGGINAFAILNSIQFCEDSFNQDVLPYNCNNDKGQNWLEMGDCVVSKAVASVTKQP